MKLASLFKKLLLIFTVPTALLTVGSCFIAYFPIASLPFLDEFGIFVPLLFLINILLFVFWILIEKRYALISFTALVVCFVSFGSSYQTKFSNQNLAESDFSILSYNVQGFSSFREEGISDFTKSEIYNFIISLRPDILCFQEYGRGMTRSFNEYPYQYQTPYRSHKTIQAIFSKYPIIDSGSLEFPNSRNNSIFADIVYKMDTIRIYNVHFESFKIRSFKTLLKVDFGLQFFRRMEQIAIKHREQVRILQGHSEESPYPVVYVGDFNQPEYSPSFRKLQKGMSDSFKEKGRGWGTTFKRNIISARIDFILSDNQYFEVLDHQNFDLEKSDHLPIMARLKYFSD